MKKIYLVSLFLAIFLFTGCALTQKPAKNNPNSGNEAVKTPVDTNEDLVYSDPAYGFSITFPQTWQGYITKQRTLDWGELGMSYSVDFGFIEQDSIFNISVHTIDQWNKIQKQEGPRPVYLGENNKYVFAYAISQYQENETMADRWAEVSRILPETFVLSESNELDISYNNSTYGFTLSFPLSWKGFVTKERLTEWGSVGSANTIDFGFKENDSLFAITVFSKGQWKDISAYEGSKPTYLGEKGKYVFAYDQTNGAIDESLVPRASEIPVIMETFDTVKTGNQ